MLIVLSRTIFSRLLIPSDFIHDLFSASLWHWTGLIITFLMDLFLLLMSLTLPGFLGYLATDLVSCLPAVIFYLLCSSCYTHHYFTSCTVCSYPVLTIHDHSSFYCFMQMIPSSTALLLDCTKAPATPSELAARHHYLHVPQFLLTKNF